MKKITVFLFFVCTVLVFAKRYPITKYGAEEWLTTAIVGNDPFLCMPWGQNLVVGYDWSSGTKVKSFNIQSDGGLLPVSVNGTWTYNTAAYCYSNLCRYVPGGDSTMLFLNDSFLDETGYMKVSSISASGRFSKIVFDSVSLTSNCDQAQALYMNNDIVLVIALGNSATGGNLYAKSFAIDSTLKTILTKPYADSEAVSGITQAHGPLTAIKLSNTLCAVSFLEENIGGDTDLGTSLAIIQVDTGGVISCGWNMHLYDGVSEWPAIAYNSEEQKISVMYHNITRDYYNLITIEKDSSATVTIPDYIEFPYDTYFAPNYVTQEYIDTGVAQSTSIWYKGSLFPLSNTNSSWMSVWPIAYSPTGRYGLYVNTFRLHKNRTRYQTTEITIPSDTLSLSAGYRFYEASNVLCHPTMDSIYYVAFADSSSGTNAQLYIWTMKIISGSWSNDYLDTASPATINGVPRTSIGDVNGVD
jgi:hypothetical protein